MAGKPRDCRECGRPTLVKDVGEERNLYGLGRGSDILCKDCQRKRIDAMIEDNRRRMGMPERGR